MLWLSYRAGAQQQLSLRLRGKNNANLLIDYDQGETVSAQVVFDTEGSGTIGWVHYDIQTHQLLNTSAELETPEPLTFKQHYADQYEHCIRAD